ncbi:hypothetical protein Tco_0217087 [Tanacetum coccineum]
MSDSSSDLKRDQSTKPKAVTTVLQQLKLLFQDPRLAGCRSRANYDGGRLMKLAQRLPSQKNRIVEPVCVLEERSKLFIELMDKRKKHFAKLRAEEIRRKPPTKTQKRNKDTELVKESFKKAEMIQKSSSKRAGDELEQEKTKKQKIDDDEAYMKKYMEVVPDDEVAIDAIPLAIKPPVIVDWKIIKEGKIGYFQIIRADGSSRSHTTYTWKGETYGKTSLSCTWVLFGREKMEFG